MKVPELGLLEPADVGPQLGQASPVSQGAVVAADGLLSVLLRLVQLPELLPQAGLGGFPEQGLHTAVHGFQLPMEGPCSGGPWNIIWFVGVPRATAM